MRYGNIVRGSFVSRPNRFIANVRIDGREEVCHVKNTGRCRELLPEGAEVYLEKSGNLARKTAFDLVAVRKEAYADMPAQIINMDSQAPNAVVKEWLEGGGLYGDISLVRPETVYGDSRFDFYLETESGKKMFLEVKGVTLEANGIARFPDAPTERGIKHIKELEKALEAGYEAGVMFVIQMKNITKFEPNAATHPEFAAALRSAAEKGVKIMAYDCRVTADSLTIDSPVEICL